MFTSLVYVYCKNVLAGRYIGNSLLSKQHCINISQILTANRVIKRKEATFNTKICTHQFRSDRCRAQMVHGIKREFRFIIVLFTLLCDTLLKPLNGKWLKTVRMSSRMTVKKESSL